MCKCDSCLFIVKDGFRDMGFSCDTCSLKLRIEELKRVNGVKYDLFNSLLSNKKSCKYYVDKNSYLDFVIELYK